MLTVGEWEWLTVGEWHGFFAFFTTACMMSTKRIL